MPIVGEYKRGERGREAPKSLLGEKMIEASANIALRITFVCVSVLRDEEDGRERGGLGRSPPPPFIDKRRGGVHVWEISEVVAVGCSGCSLLKVHCGALGSMALGVVVILGSPLALRRSRRCPGDSCGHRDDCC